MALLSENSQLKGHAGMPQGDVEIVPTVSFEQIHLPHALRGAGDVWNGCKPACGRAVCDDGLEGQYVMNDLICADHEDPRTILILNSHGLSSQGLGRRAAGELLYQKKQAADALQEESDTALFSNNFIIASNAVNTADMCKGTF